MLFNHDSGLIQSVLTIDTTVAPTLGGSQSLQIVGNGGLILPVGTTEQRPAGVAGMQRFNSTLSKLEYHDGTAWVSGVDGTVTSVTVASDNAALTVTNGTVTDSGTITLSLDQTLVNLATSAPSASGSLVARLADDTFVSRDLKTVTGSAVQIANGDGVAGNPTFSLGTQLENINDVTTSGFLTLDGTGAATTKTFAASGNITLTETAGVLTFGYQASGDLAALTALGNGIVVKTGASTYAAGTITGGTTTSGTVTVTGGASATPTITFDGGVELGALATTTATGLLSRNGAGSYTGHTLKVAGAGMSIANGDGATAGDITITYTPSANLAGLSALSGTGYLVQTAAGTFAERTFAVGAGVTAGHLTISNADGTAGATSFDFVAGTEVAGIAALASTGLVTRTTAGTYIGRTLTSANSYITVANGDGVAADPQVTFVPGTNLTALSTTTATGLLQRAADGSITGRTVVGAGSITVADGTGADAGKIIVSYTAGANLGAINALATSGMVAFNSSTGAFSGLTIAGTAGNIVVTNGDGVAGAPTVNLAAVTDSGTGTFKKIATDSFGRVTGTTDVVLADITGLVDGTYVNVIGDNMSGNLTFNGIATVTGLAAPTAASDAATKNYVDSAVSGLSWKQAVDTVGTALPGTAVTGARFLNTTDGKIYTATATNTWNAGVAATDGDAVFDRATETGYVYSGTAWTIFTGTGQIAAGVGLSKTGNQMDINLGAGIAQLPTDEVGIDLANPTSGGLRLRLAGVDSTDTAAQLTLVLKSAGGLTQDADGLYVPAAGVTNAMLANSKITVTGNTGSDDLNLGESLAITGAGALSTTIGANSVTVSVADATTTTLGVASFAAADFAVAAGAVSLVGKTLDQAATDVTITSVANGDLLVYNSTTGQWENKLQSAIVPAIGVDALTDVTITSAASGQVLQYNGSQWVNLSLATAGIQAKDAGLDSLAGLTGPGFVTVDATGNTFTSRTLVAGSGVAIDVANGSANPTISNTGVLSVASAGTGVAVDVSAGNITITGSAVTDVVPGAGISALTVNGITDIANTGVLTVTTSGTGISANVSATGNVTITGNAVTSVTPGTGISASVTAGALSVANTGVVTLAGTTGKVDVAHTGTDYTVTLPASVTIDTALTVTGLGANKALVTGAAGLVSGVSLADGQFLIGATGGAPAAATITAGTGVTVTPSANGLTIAVAGGAALNSVAVTTASAGALTVTAGGTSVNPTFALAADAGLESLAALSTTGIVVASAANTFVTRTLVAGTGISLVNDAGVAGDITIANTGVTSVGLSLPGIFTVTGSPVTTTGTLTATLASQAAGTVFAAPAVGSGAPTFRALAYSDLPIQLYVEDTTAKTVDLTANSVAHASGNFAAAGDASAIEMVLRNTTSDATATELFVNGSSVQAALPANATWNFTVQIVGRGTGTAGAYRFDGIVSRDAAASSTAFIGVPSKVILGETFVDLDAAVVADTATGALKVTVTGKAATSMKWVATIRATQVIG